jgi:hypothetical protein
MDERYAPNPDVPESSFIVSGETTSENTSSLPSAFVIAMKPMISRGASFGYVPVSSGSVRSVIEPTSSMANASILPSQTISNGHTHPVSSHPDS